MKFNTKTHTKAEFYPTYLGWCKQHGFPQVTDLWLPEMCMVCYFEETPIYCVWLWETNSKLMWIGFPASDKSVDYDQKDGGLDFLLEQVNIYAKRQNYVAVFTTSGMELIITALMNTGFVEADTNINQYIKKL